MGEHASANSNSNAVSILEGVVACLHCLLLLAAAFVMLDRYFQNRQLQAAAATAQRQREY